MWTHLGPRKSVLIIEVSWSQWLKIYKIQFLWAKTKCLDYTRCPDFRESTFTVDIRQAFTLKPHIGKSSMWVQGSFLSVATHYPVVGTHQHPSNQYSQTLTSLHLQDLTSSVQASFRALPPLNPPVIKSWGWSPPNPRHTAAWSHLLSGQGPPLSSSTWLQCYTTNTKVRDET